MYLERETTAEGAPLILFQPDSVLLALPLCHQLPKDTNKCDSLPDFKTTIRHTCLQFVTGPKKVLSLTQCTTPYEYPYESTKNQWITTIGKTCIWSEITL